MIKKLKSKLPIFLILLSAISCLLFAAPVSAAGLIPCGGPTEKMCDICDFFKLIQNIINFILFAFASLAALAAVYIAFLFMFSGGSPAKITDAKSKLWLMVIGIFWVLGSWLVLNTILNFMVDKSVFPWPWNKINCVVSRPTIPVSAPKLGDDIIGVLKGEALSEEKARDKLQQAGIIVNKDPCPAGVDYHNVPGGCTSLNGAKVKTIEGAILLKYGCQCDLEITGGTEFGHDPGAYSHGNGYKLDFHPNPALDKYIPDHYPEMDSRSDGSKVYRAPNGTIYVRESTHWDVTFGS